MNLFFHTCNSPFLIFPVFQIGSVSFLLSLGLSFHWLPTEFYVSGYQEDIP
ncbi:hypothetical protein HOLDEFILI_02117 [Holdemania filiformis DSM 12042]|uniref:Uncharacterized protein n=1 Tax=Holdemania filiformis DSM 12042 TaxID=545696 RepID=B9Y8G9_9FIRM|nr:hypothetical protein HOLDEFILI_02117 [Holdemania filiformis DSM 12042]